VFFKNRRLRTAGFINGTYKNQLPLFASSIDDAIAQDNEIRLIALFIDSLLCK